MVRNARNVRNVRNVRLFYIHQGPGRTQRAAAKERGCKRAAQAQGSRQAKRPTTPLPSLARYLDLADDADGRSDFGNAL